MAHLRTLCELKRWRMRRVEGPVGVPPPTPWRGLLPMPCALCGMTTRGAGLCRLCHDMVQGKQGNGVRCARCALVLHPQETCPDCLVTLGSFDRVIAAFDYDAPASLLIHRLKAQRRFTDVPLLTNLLANAIASAWPDLPVNLRLVPVPASARSIRQRGFNPAADVARLLARRLKMAYRPSLVRRVTDGVKQATLGREARLMATARLYHLAGNVQGAHIAIVDDVLTTGSTMHSIARMLKRGGAASVHGLVLARTQRRHG